MCSPAKPTLQAVSLAFSIFSFSIFKFYLFKFYFFGCAESLLLHMDFLYLQRVGATLVVARGLLIAVASLVEHRL